MWQDSFCRIYCRNTFTGTDQWNLLYIHFWKEHGVRVLLYSGYRIMRHIYHWISWRCTTSGLIKWNQIHCFMLMLVLFVFPKLLSVDIITSKSYWLRHRLVLIYRKKTERFSYSSSQRTCHSSHSRPGPQYISDSMGVYNGRKWRTRRPSSYSHRVRGTRWKIYQLFWTCATL